MKTFTRRLLGALLPACAALPVMGVPANPVPRVLTQPDGTTVTLSLRGDERCHYYTTESGLIVRQDDNGWYRVVANDGSLSTYTPADFAVKASAPQGFNPEQAFESIQSIADRTSAFARTSYAGARTYTPSRVIAGGKYDNADGHDIRNIPTTGSPHVLVVLVNFSDKAFSFASDPHTEMTNMMNQPGYSNYRCTGSAFDFYSDQSRGQYTPHFDVYGPVTLPQTSRYYATTDARAVEMVTEACRMLDKDVDFAQYDTNGDGEVDNVYIFFAGYSQAEGGGSDCIWPHAWEVQYADVCPVLDGVKINRYACSNELRNTGGSTKDPAAIGTFCHEFGHVLGQPDMYSVSYNDAAFTPGSYSAMDHGSYNNDGRTPPNFSAYERYAMEWIKPIELTGPASISMLPLGDDGNVYKINIDPAKPTEYWLFENRQQTGWDTYIPGHGMLIWHIDFVQSVWDSNKVNDTAAHQYVDIVEADGTQSEGSRASDTFPGTQRITSFTSSTTPAFRSWTNKYSTLDITDITESKAGVISFNVAGGATSGDLYLAAPRPRQEKGSASSMTISWDPVPGAESYLISLWSQMVDPLWGDILTEFVPGYEFADVASNTSITVEGLSEGTTYQAVVYAKGKQNVSPAGEGAFATFSSDLKETTPLLTIDADDVTARAEWSEVPDATEYLLTVATRAEGAYTVVQEVPCDNKKIPADWMFTGLFDERADYSGNAIPSLRFNVQECTIFSGEYDGDIAEIDFWARVNRQDPKFKLEFYGVYDNGTMVKFATVSDVAANKTGSNVQITGIPDGVRRWMCIYTFDSADLVLNIDDIVVKTRGSVTDTPIEGYDAKPVTGGQHTITGLQRSTPYVAYLTARNSAVSSKPSQTIHFTTLATTGIDNIFTPAETVVFTVSGGLLTSSSDEPFSLYTTDGRTLATGVRGSIQLPAPGLYIVRSGAVARTIRY